ncbi:MAG: flagellar filament capping protein FliD [Clostridium sp.]
MRITGLATGLDMDKIITDSMKPYRIKIDQQQQKKDIIEIKQKLYREVLKDSREFYNKYFDVTSKDNLLLSTNYNTVKFTSSNESVVSVSGSSDAKAGNYTITGEVGTAAKAVITDGIADKEKITINGKEYELKGSNQKEIAKNLNEQLKKDKVNVTVRYTDMAATEGQGNKSGLVFESTVVGEDSTFTIGGKFTEIAGTVVEGKDKTGSSVSGINLQALKDAKGEFKVGDKTLKIDIKDGATDKDIEKALNEKLKEEKLTASIGDGKITFTSTDIGNPEVNFTVDVNGETGTFTAGEKGVATTNTVGKDSFIGKKIDINGTLIDMSKAKAGEEVEYLNKMLSGKGITASKDASGDFVFTADEVGKDKKIEIKGYDGTNAVDVTAGKDANILIKDGKGGVYSHKGSSNTVVIDGITFNFTGEIPKDGITITGKNDVTEVKDKIVNFVNDYNKLMEKLNTVVMEKPNKEFMPLTAEQKKDMSEDEIKLWNEKVKKGQLSRDSDITRIINSLKNAVTTPVNGGGLNLEKIGITPFQDYAGTKNGTFTIDEAKLTKALEENLDDVMNMFIGQPKASEGMTDGEKYGQTGIMHRMKDILYKETVTVESRLVKKAGIEGSASVSNNELTRSMERYEKKIKDMEKDFARREQALYSKYARLEVMMNKYNAQQSQLMQQMGG